MTKRQYRESLSVIDRYAMTKIKKRKLKKKEFKCLVVDLYTSIQRDKSVRSNLLWAGSNESLNNPHPAALLLIVYEVVKLPTPFSEGVTWPGSTYVWGNM